MNTELVESALEAAGRKLVVVDDTELNDDLVEDVVAVLTSFCARLYGKRGAKNRALKAVGVVTDAAENPQNAGKSVVSA
jgi:putative resolvase